MQSVSPIGETKKALRLLQELVGRELGLPTDEVPVGVDYLSMGFSSRGLIGLIQQLSGLLQTKLSPSVLFDYRTLTEFADYLAEYHAQQLASMVIEQQATEGQAEQGDSRVMAPLSEVQRGLWFLQKSHPRMAAYNVPLCLRLSPRVQRERMRKACAWLLRRWPMLGASVQQVDGRLVMVMQEQTGRELPWYEHQAEGWSEEARRLSWLGDRLAEPFDLDSGPLVRAFWLGGEADGGSRLLLVVHHLVIDAVSVGILLAGLRKIYEDLEAGRGLDGATDGRAYSAFIATETARLSGVDSVACLAYWREQLADARSSLGLPLDRPRGATPSFKGCTLRRELPATLSASLQAYTERHGVYPSTLLLAVFQGLLSRHAGRDDVVVGMAMDERDAASAGLVGMFVNMLPMRARGLGRRGFGEDVQALQRQLVDAMAHAYPFPALVRELGLSGSDASPLFQAAFLYQDTLDVDALAEVEDWTWEEALYQEGEYELVLEVRGGRQGYALYFKYDPTLWDESTIERWLGHYLHLLEGVLADPWKRLSEHELRGEHEHAQLTSWQGEVRDWALTPVAALFERQVVANAQAWAVSDEQQRWSYAELAAHSSAIAQRLRAQGIGVGSIVGICQGRSPWLLASLLGIWQAGAAYVPLDPAYPAERLRYMLEDSGAGAALSDTAHLAQVQTLAGALPVWAADDVPEASAPLSMPMPQSQDLAYVLYTSGSTGRPKGVRISHGALSNFLQSMVKTPGLQASDRLLAVTTISFDIAGLELYLPLIGGGECVLCSAEISRDGRRLKAEVERVRPTLMQATPATWSMLFHAGWRNAEGLKVLCGGEALPTRLKQRFDEIGTTVWNLYGPTETTIWSTLAKLDASALIHIGRPIANTQAYVLDEDGREQPIGIEGELYLGGAGLAQGYHGQPERTSQAFIDHPFGRLYRTGDLARWRADGQLEHRGRSDQQVKVNGYRVEPGEIEAVLEQSDLVKQAAVVLREGAHGSQLAAWCVPTKATHGDTWLDSIQVQALQAQLRDRLPAYMRPAIWLSTAVLPQTPNGKVDRQALRARALPAQSDGKTPPSAATSRNAARLELESRLQALWAEVLERPTVGRDERFLEAGGNSVAAVLLAERIQAEFGRAFGVAQVFAHISVAAQAAYLDGGGPTPEAPVNNEPIAPRVVAAEPEPDANGIAEDALAIIGIACHFPGAENHRAFWDNLRAGHDSARLFSPEALRAVGVPERLIADPQYVPVHYGINGKAEFDAEFFNLPPRTVTRMDPPFRLLLQHAWAAIEDAGYTPEAIPDTGVFMSASFSAYQARLQDPRAVEPGDRYVAWLMSQGGSLPTLVSYQLGLTGPSLFVQTNCSSFLSALAAARRSLLARESRLALVGAATLFAEHGKGYLHEPGLNFSSDGHCKTFDASADGMVSGEGGGVVLLKLAREAVADGDHIYALLRGVAVNNDGADKAGFYAPSVRGQSEVIEQALRQARIDPAQIGYVEAHGTGTRLGDPIEVTALSETYRRHTQARQYCAIGSVKSNLGHLDTAAGLAGCIKLALSLQHGEIPPTLHYKRPNPAIDFAASPFYVAERVQAWPPGARLAGLSAFGIGGTNAHAILEAYLEESVEAPANAAQLIVLSARTQERLRAVARQVLDHLDSSESLPSLRDLAYTLQVGRRSMTHRLAFVAEDMSGLRRQLSDHLAGRKLGHEGDCDRGHALLQAFEHDDDSARLFAQWAAAGKLDKLATLWVQGLSLDWALLHGTQRLRRVSLPTYPFERTCHWLEAPAAAIAADPEPLEIAPERAWDGMSYLPRWVAMPAITHDAQASSAPTSLLIVAPESSARVGQLFDWCAQRWPSAALRLIRLGRENRRLGATERICNSVDDGQALSEALQEGNWPDSVVFLADTDAETGTVSSWPGHPESAEAQLLRVQRALNQGQQAPRTEFYLVTIEAKNASDASTGGGLSGLAYAMAQGDHRLRLRHLSLDAEAWSASSWWQLWAEPASERGESVRFSGGERWRQRFERLDWGSLHDGGLKQGGVYLIAGGSGTLGTAISRYLIERYRARVIWLGRSRVDASGLAARLQALEAGDLGDLLPSYIQADLTDAGAVREAVARAKQIHGTIDGAIFSAMHRCADAPAERWSPTALAEAVAVKALGARHFHQALLGESLDFLCYYSSVQSFAFLSARDSAAYAVGVAAADRYVQSIRAQSPFRVGLIHWGYWKNSLAGTALEQDLARHFTGIHADEACVFFERFVAALGQGVLDQAICLKASDTVRDLMPSTAVDVVAVAAVGTPSFLDSFDAAALRSTVVPPDWTELDRCLRGLLCAQLRRLGLFDQASVSWDGEQLRRKLGVIDDYRRWWDECCTEILEADGWICTRKRRVELLRALSLEQADALWQDWERDKVGYLQDPQLHAALLLVEDCLRHLPEVLRGQTTATSVIFADGSTSKVAGLYQGTSWTDSFNHQVADTVEAYVRHRLAAEPQARLRVLEVGAGTGGTTAKVLPRLAAIGAPMLEYCYTDLSEAFLAQARERHLAEHPYLRACRCDIERPLAEQGIVPGNYDIVIATNCLHATHDIRATLRHVQAALRCHGVLIVNEGVSKSLLGTLTFGLLEGWWLYDDPQLRIPGSPLLDSAHWQALLVEAGMRPVCLDGPGRELQQVWVAESHGLMRPGGAAPMPVVPLAAPSSAQAGGGVTEPAASTSPASSSEAVPHAVIAAEIRACLAETLKREAADLADETAFSDYGIDSILSVALVKGLNQRLGIQLGQTVIYDYSTIAALSRHVLEQHGGRASVVQNQPKVASSSEPVVAEATPTATMLAPATVSEQLSSAAEASRPAPIAVVGMALQVPDAEDADTFWANLLNGRDSIRELPEAYGRAARGASPHGGALQGRDHFDAAFFGLSHEEASGMSPAQRLVLEEGWKALEDAGYDPRGLRGSRTAVFVGAEPSSFFQGSFSGSSEAIIASRLSYLLDLKGPALVVNTGCSSGAMAIHLACESLRHGETQLALAGGVAAALSVEGLGHLADAGMLSPQWRCLSFEAAGDGMVLSEAVGMLVLKRLDQAAADGDAIHGVIEASGSNQDGTSNGITAPNGRAQEELLSETWERHGIAPERISHFEVHGTGTLLGDAVEGNAIGRAFGRVTTRRGFCVIGTSKTHIGHTGAASGVVGLIKLLLSLRHRRLPGLLHFEQANPLIDWNGSALRLPDDAATAWNSEPGLPRYAGLNAFGHSGTNVHMVVREYGPGQGDRLGPQLLEQTQEVLLPLSAAGAPQLARIARRLLDFLDKTRHGQPQPSLAELAYTCQTGRSALAERAVLKADDREQLRALLQALAEQRPIVGLWRGSVDPEMTLAVAADRTGLDELAASWVQGADVDWLKLYGPVRPQRCHLPTYPFDRQHLPWHLLSTQISSSKHPAPTPAKSVATATATAAAAPAWRFVLAATAEVGADPRAKATQWLRRWLAMRLQRPVQALNPQLSYRELGLTSLGLVALSEELSRLLGVAVLPSVLFEYPSIARLAEHLAEHHAALLLRVQSIPRTGASAGASAEAPVPDRVLSVLQAYRNGALDHAQARAMLAEAIP
ncbi:MAG: amino acid adenylation domain-containing protein [Burkholderia sp.]